MRRLSAPGIMVPLLLILIGSALIAAGGLRLDTPVAGLPDISDIPEASLGLPTPAPSASGSEGASSAPTPSPTPPPANWVAVQIQIKAVGLNVLVKQSHSLANDGYPLEDAAYILSTSSQPGRGTNSYMVAHAYRYLFKPLWNVVPGDEVKILMSDGRVLHYIVTEIHPNQSCPQREGASNPSPPPALKLAEPGCQAAQWQRPTGHERLTLQTSQGYNRNWGEFMIIAQPLF
jgi:hypothetical protein